MELYNPKQEIDDLRAELRTATTIALRGTFTIEPPPILTGIHEPSCDGDCGGLYDCAGCGRACGWCFGCGDELFDFCDDCAVATWEIEDAIKAGAK